MAKQWYIPLDMGDWTQDTDALTLEAEGALLRIIFKLWKAPEKGRLIFAFDSLSRIIKKAPSEARKIIQELQQNDILNIEFLDGDQVKIESRRMLKEAALSAARSESGKLGGRPKKQTKNKKKAKQKQIPEYDYDYNSDYDSDSSSELDSSSGENFNSEITQVIEHLNALADRRFHPNNTMYARQIAARFKDGYTLEELLDIVALKVKEWKGTEMEQYLQPDTLFNKTKCNKYRDQVAQAKRTGKVNTSKVVGMKNANLREQAAQAFAKKHNIQPV